MTGFDYIGFSKAVKQSFEQDTDLTDKSIRSLSVYTGISSATISRFFRGKKVDLETALVMQHFADVMINDYILY